MAGGLDFVQSLFDVVVPLSKLTIRELLLLREDYDALQAVDLCCDALLHNHVTKLSLGSLNGNTYENAKPLKLYAAVIPLDDADVVLDHLPEQLDQVGLGIFSLLLERFELDHLSLYLILTERADFERQELFGKL